MTCQAFFFLKEALFNSFGNMSSSTESEIPLVIAKTHDNVSLFTIAHLGLKGTCLTVFEIFMNNDMK